MIYLKRKADLIFLKMKAKLIFFLKRKVERLLLEEKGWWAGFDFFVGGPSLLGLPTFLFPLFSL